MKKIYDIHYNDNAYYGTMVFRNKSQVEIENRIKEEIKDNNKTPNPLYHITRDNFKEL